MSSSREPEMGKFEEHAYVLDFMPLGRPGRRALPTVQVVGETYFTLLEAELKPGVKISVGERLAVGKEGREKVSRIMGRIGYAGLTGGAKAELPTVLEDMVRNQEQRFVTFFNRAGPLTPRMHALELLPEVGKKRMWSVVDARDRAPFADYNDIKSRTGIGDPARTVARRITNELESGEEKYRLFTRPI